MASNTFSNTSTGGKPEDPYKAKNLDTEATVKEKIDDLSKFVQSVKFGMMTTRESKTGYLHSRAMALAAQASTPNTFLPQHDDGKTDIQQETGGIDLLFHTNTESGKTDELAADPHVNMAFINSSGEWASVSGTASVETDRGLVRKHYSSALKAWVGDLGDGTHDGGPDDPRICIIRLKTHSATYSVSKKNVVARVAEVAQGAVTGRVPDIQKLREISEEDVQTWRQAN